MGRSQADWVVVEKEYRAGIKALRQIAEEHGITEGAIRKRAKRDEWTRDLTGRIHAKAEELVRKEEVRSAGTQSQLDAPTEREVVNANATAIAAADLTNRKDVILGIDISRGHLHELAALSEPGFRERLEWLGKVMDESGKDEETGREVKDKVNELYQYIISLGGRIKMAKEAAAAIGVYIPMQRKILKLDEDASRNQSDVDSVLKKILQGGNGAD
jgi:hypothetical protein